MPDFKIGDEVITLCENHPGRRGVITSAYGDVFDIKLDGNDLCASRTGELTPIAPAPDEFVWLDYAEDIARIARLLNNFVEALNESLPGSNSDLEWRLEDGGVRAYLYDEPTRWIVKRSESVEAIGLVIE